MTMFWRTVSLITMCLLIIGWSFVEATEVPLQGPILASQFIQQITFQDVGSDRLWRLDVEMNTNFVSWSPDGCNILLIQRSTSNAQWLLLPVNELELDNLPSQTKSPIWYPDGQSLTYRNYSDDTQITSVYSLDLQNQEVAILFEVEGIGIPLQWLSENELLYTKDGYRFVWNAATQQTRLFGTDHYPRYAKPEDTASRFFYYKDDISPNQELLVGFYDIASYRSALDPRDNHLTDEYVQKIQSQKPEITGFDIYALIEDTSKHVDVNGAFVESVSWSPSNEMIAVTTYY